MPYIDYPGFHPLLRDSRCLFARETLLSQAYALLQGMHPTAPSRSKHKRYQLAPATLALSFLKATPQIICRARAATLLSILVLFSA